MTEKYRNFIVVVILIALLTFTLGVFVFTRSEEPIDVIYEGSSLEKNQVSIKDGEEIFREVGGFEAYDRISEELYVFAKSAYEKYSHEAFPVIGFAVSDVDTSEDIKFSGNFGANNNSIEVVVKQLKSDRINISITDLKTDLNIDEFLNANNQRNSFIGSTPIETEGYVIEYLEDQDIFTVNVFNNSDNYNEAIEFMKKGLSETFEDETVIRYGVGDKNQEFGL